MRRRNDEVVLGVAFAGMAEADDGDGCRDGGAAEASTVMLVAAEASTGSRAAQALRAMAQPVLGALADPWWRFALAWCRFAWWPLCRRWRRAAAESPRLAAGLRLAERAVPWAFAAAAVPSATGGDLLPLRDGRTLRRGQAFGGSAGRLVRCEPRASEVTVGAVGARPRGWRRRDSEGNVVGWRMARREVAR